MVGMDVQMDEFGIFFGHSIARLKGRFDLASLEGDAPSSPKVFELVG
jgi:hypothetical protein